MPFNYNSNGVFRVPGLIVGPGEGYALYLGPDGNFEVVADPFSANPISVFSASTSGFAGIGGGTAIRKISAGTVSVDPPNQGAAGFFTHAITITGASVGDVVILHPPSTLENQLRLVGYSITGADTVTLKMEATAAVNGAALSWDYVLYDLTA